MTITEAKATIYANVVYACEKAGFPPATTRLVQDACDTIIAIADACETIVALADRETEPTTQTETQNSNLTFEKRCKGCGHYKLTCDLFSEVCKYEPTTEDCSMVEPQSGYCNECKWYGDKQVCGRCRDYNLYSHTKTEPQTEVSAQEYERWLFEEPQTMRDENYIYAYDKTHGEWYPIQEIERPCDNCQEWDCYGCDYK